MIRSGRRVTGPTSSRACGRSARGRPGAARASPSGPVTSIGFSGRVKEKRSGATELITMGRHLNAVGHIFVQSSCITCRTFEDTSHGLQNMSKHVLAYIRIVTVEFALGNSSWFHGTILNPRGWRVRSFSFHLVLVGHGPLKPSLYLPNPACTALQSERDSRRTPCHSCTARTESTAPLIRPLL